MAEGWGTGRGNQWQSCIISLRWYVYVMFCWVARNLWVCCEETRVVFIPRHSWGHKANCSLPCVVGFFPHSNMCRPVSMPGLIAWHGSQDVRLMPFQPAGKVLLLHLKAHPFMEDEGALLYKHGAAKESSCQALHLNYSNGWGGGEGKSSTLLDLPFLLLK